MPDLVDTERSPEYGASGRSCLSDDEILDFAAGRVAHEQLAAVHSHLDRCAVCQRLIGEAVREKSSDDGSPVEVAWATTFRSGDVIGSRYRVQRFIARGGMGEVYDAYDRDLQKRIALKTVISSVCDSQRAVRRLKAEVQLAHRVSHPNVCRIYDLGAHRLSDNAGTLHFLTMEFVEGERLGERLKRGALTVAEATHIARELLSGLSAAHAAGILHRDLKSDNIMLRPAPKDGIVPVLLDFGLARTIDAGATRVTSGVNGFLGTPCYMAPEQLEAGELTPASDVYAFGVIWFEMLTGRLPFSLRTPFDRLHKRPPRPSSFSADVPPALDKIVLGCLERVPEARFASADEILAALDAMDARTSSARVSGISRRNVPAPLVPSLVGVGLVALLVFSRAHVRPAMLGPPSAVAASKVPKGPPNPAAGAAAKSDAPSTTASRVAIGAPAPTPAALAGSATTDAKLRARPAPKREAGDGARPHATAVAKVAPDTPPGPLASPSGGAVGAFAASTELASPEPAPSSTPPAYHAPVKASQSVGVPRAPAAPSPEGMGFANPFKRRAP